MTDKIITVMGYPDKPNNYRFNTNRRATASNNKNKHSK